MFAAFYAGLRGMSARIIDSLPELGGQLTALYPEKYIYDMPGFPKILAKSLAESMVEQCHPFKQDVVLEETACHLSTLPDETYSIRTDKGTEYPTKTIIISAGAGAFTPTKLGVLREDEFFEKGIHYGVRDRSRFAGKRITIVGGGDSAFDWCLNLSDIAKSTTLVHRRDVFKAHDDTVKKVLESDVTVRLWSAVKELHGTTSLQGITLENTKTKETEHLESDAIIVNIGFKSNLGPIKDWGFELERNTIVVDDKYETNLRGVFAVGDVCTYGNKLKLIATGVGEAATAVCYAKTYLDPNAKLFPGHSSDREELN